jgi:hypothetical protein
MELKINFGLLFNSILCTFVCWNIVNYFFIPITFIKFVLLELCLTTLHKLFSWLYSEL